MTQEQTKSFTPETKKAGDLIKSQDWNAAMGEIVRLDAAKVNRAGADTLAGPLTIQAALTAQSNVTVSGTVGFGAVTRQMLNFYNTDYGLGIQSSTHYFRSGKNFAWYRGGTHNDAELNAGGGTLDMSLSNGTLSVTGTFKLSKGATVNELSTDGGLAGNSDSALPTQKAVKSYVDAKVVGSNTQDFTARNLTVAGSASFGAATRQMVNLYNTDYGIGIQSSTHYFRTGKNFAWFRGGSHNDAELNAGGGTLDMSLNNGTLSVPGNFTLSKGATVNELSADGGLAGNSDSALPTQKAVKTYVDTRLAGFSAAGSNSQDFTARNLTVAGSVNFGAAVRQMINLWNTNYGIGVQSSTYYNRTDKNFAWFRGGSHNDGELNAGGGTADMVLSNGSLGIGTGATAPAARLQVKGGAIMPDVGNSETSGIMFPKDPFGGSGDAAWLRYYARSAESSTLEIGISNDPDDHIALMAAGNVGIGINAPAAKLDINGGYIILRSINANNDNAKNLLNSLPNSSTIIGSCWRNSIYFYWKDDTGQRYFAMLPGSTAF